ncbi:Filamentous hemagglutinin [Frankliniella fusca]|uniref:Filamentous hemagglutinin n=1 Tax=Frankliniella fusca TaxID=407009 RepID=A0AAE1LTH4_9NEOP|nr:Filamentous hemagglutinin [Frankliniella fusca]
MACEGKPTRNSTNTLTCHSPNLPFPQNRIAPPNPPIPQRQAAPHLFPPSNLPIPQNPAVATPDPNLHISVNCVLPRNPPIPPHRVAPVPDTPSNLPFLQNNAAPPNITIPQNHLAPSNHSVPSTPIPTQKSIVHPAADIDNPVAITTIEIESGGTALTLRPPHLKVHPPTSIPHVDKHDYGQTPKHRVLMPKRKLIEVDPLLTPQDVPGAILNTDHLEQYSVDDLKRWLACRGILVSGNKADLISRIKAHVKMGKSHKIDPKIDRGHWHDKKRAKVVTEMKRNGVCGPPLPPNKDWQPFPGYNIPKGFSKEAVDRYLEDDCPTFKFSHDCGVRFEDSDDPDDDFDVEQEPVQYQVKSNVRRGTKYLKSGNILSVLDNYDGVHYYVKAQVQASMEDVIHVVRATFIEASGEIVDCSCECKARALKRCSHIVAVLLLLLEHIDTKGHDEQKLSSDHMFVDCITECLPSHLHSFPIIMTPHS